MEYNASHYITLHFYLSCIALYCIVQHSIALSCTVLHCTTLYFTTLECTVFLTWLNRRSIICSSTWENSQIKSSVYVYPYYHRIPPFNLTTPSFCGSSISSLSSRSLEIIITEFVPCSRWCTYCIIPRNIFIEMSHIRCLCLYIIITSIFFTVLYYTFLYYAVLYCTVLHHAVLYFTLLLCYYDILHRTVLYCTVLYCTVLYCTVDKCMILHVPHSTL